MTRFNFYAFAICLFFGAFIWYTSDDDTRTLLLFVVFGIIIAVAALLFNAAASRRRERSFDDVPQTPQRRQLPGQQPNIIVLDDPYGHQSGYPGWQNEPRMLPGDDPHSYIEPPRSNGRADYGEGEAW